LLFAARGNRRSRVECRAPRTAKPVIPAENEGHDLWMRPVDEKALQCPLAGRPRIAIFDNLKKIKRL
jgi:hypothetical protein